jgi:hypothetical protein
MVPNPVNTDLREQSFFIGQAHLLALWRSQPQQSRA